MFLVLWERLMGYLMKCDNVWNLKHFLIRMREKTWRLIPTFFLAGSKQHSWSDSQHNTWATYLQHFGSNDFEPMMLWRTTPLQHWDEEMLIATNAQMKSVLKIKSTWIVTKGFFYNYFYETRVLNKSDFHKILCKFKYFAHAQSVRRIFLRKQLKVGRYFLLTRFVTSSLWDLNQNRCRNCTSGPACTCTEHHWKTVSSALHLPPFTTLHSYFQKLKITTDLLFYCSF